MDENLAYISKISNLREDMEKALDFVHLDKCVRKESHVFVKPNFTYPYYKEGITTNPEFLRTLLGILRDRCETVTVGESDGGNRSYSADDAFKGHGMYKICKETGVNLVNLSKLPSVFVEENILNKKVKVQLPKLLLEDIDCFVSVPVLKVHVMTTVTLSIKNLWGCYPDTMRSLHHKNLAHKLALITKAVKPKVALIDGTFALDGHGPMFGDPKRLDLMIASNNPVVADAVGTKIMGISPDRIDHIVVAEQLGLGTKDLDQIRLNTDWEQYKQQFHLSRTLIDILSLLNFRSELLPKIVFDSPLTPVIYRLTGSIRTKEEREMSDDLKRYYR